MIKVCIEAAAGSRQKHRFDIDTRAHQGMRQVSQPYPYPYGFILDTKTTDGDGVDCYVITHERLAPGVVVECEPVGMLEQIENGEIDHKVLAAMPGDTVHLTQEIEQELRSFIGELFADNPEMHVRVERILPREEAAKHVKSCQIDTGS